MRAKLLVPVALLALLLLTRAASAKPIFNRFPTPMIRPPMAANFVAYQNAARLAALQQAMYQQQLRRVAAAQQAMYQQRSRSGGMAQGAPRPAPLPVAPVVIGPTSKLPVAPVVVGPAKQPLFVAGSNQPGRFVAGSLPGLTPAQQRLIARAAIVRQIDLGLYKAQHPIPAPLGGGGGGGGGGSCGGSSCGGSSCGGSSSSGGCGGSSSSGGCGGGGSGGGSGGGC